MEQLTLYLIGKTGNGKSSVGNSILGRNIFTVARGLSSASRHLAQADGFFNGQKIKVIDTPDPVNLDFSDTAIKAEVARWKFQSTGRCAILLAVRCDVRYTAEEYDIYKKIKEAWGDTSFRDHLVVAFTFGDRQDGDIDQELKTVCWELRSVLSDAGNRYVVFDNSVGGTERTRQLQRLEHVLHELDSKRFDSPFLQNLAIKQHPLVVLCVFIVVMIYVLRWILITDMSSSTAPSEEKSQRLARSSRAI